ncbi:MAG: hypothetical protein FJ276_29760, partial [Planctomycetes bacterium]|nr:hypothetical protein [Planctomycetota bacterium]
SIRFWKDRIEQTDADETFRVGVMYGPSGCGKSSLVRAGLLPRLAAHVVPLYVESTPGETEMRLVKKIKKVLSSPSDDLTLPEILGSLRETGLDGGRKLLLVLDQFEQWLHAHGDEPSSQLLHALRQCDGANVQCLVLVREEYAVACLRFLDQLDAEMREGENFGLVDLFDQRHAEKVLRLFGKAFGALPEKDSALSTAQEEFVTQSIRELSDEKDRVICVRLALFAEMVKNKPWVASSLTELGGAHGVGVAFLEESLSADSAKPTHRVHQKAARAVLKRLLPESETEGIKGGMRGYQDLLEASGYAKRPDDFDAVIRMLDTDLRLITPTDPAATRDEDDAAATEPAGKHYQLTHDYLVPSLRDWLTRKQRETRKGRAELRLSERSAQWNAKPENRYLPKWWEHINIRLFTRQKDWTQPQRKMMRKSRGVHGTRAAVLAVILGLVGWGAYEANGLYRAASLVATLDNAKEDAVLKTVEELRPYWRWARPLLIERLDGDPKTPAEERRQLHARVAMATEDESQVPILREKMLTGDVSYVGVICGALQNYEAEIVGRLWSILQDKSLADDRRFRAGLALAQLAPDDERWTGGDTGFMTTQLVGANPEEQRQLREYLRGVGKRLLPDVETVFADESAGERQQIGAANALADFAADDVRRLARSASIATPGQYAIVYPLIARSDIPELRNDLRTEVSKQPKASMPQKDRIALGQCRAGAAITLLRNGDREQMFDVLRVTDDPESFTQFVHRCKDRGVTASELLDCLDRADALRQPKTGEDRKSEDRVLFGLLLALGDFRLDDLPEARRQPLLDRLTGWYATEPSSAVHGATGWLLRQWGSTEAVEKIDHTPIPYDETGQREWFVLEVNAKQQEGILDLLSGGEKIHFTFIVFPAGEFMMGSPEGESDRQTDEVLHQVKLPRPVAMCDREVTWRQWTAFEGNGRLEAYSKQFNKAIGPEDPVFGVEWFDAVAYCRWLTAQAGTASTDQCYDDPESLPKDGEGNPKDWPVHLDRHGFRLPTEAEWEYVCRSGT